MPKVGAALARWMINRIVKMNAVIYIHGKGGSAAECEHYKSLFPDCEVIGLDYQTFTPWETGKVIHIAVEELKSKYENVILIAPITVVSTLPVHSSDTPYFVAIERNCFSDAATSRMMASGRRMPLSRA